ncbi:hypothetical protein [Sphingomonas sp.]|nr:hypothetical protein [Sphingomonas sp.]
MSAAILRHPAYIEWPADPRDRLPLTLWDENSRRLISFRDFRKLAAA